MENCLSVVSDHLHLYAAHGINVDRIQVLLVQIFPFIMQSSCYLAYLLSRTITGHLVFES